MVYLINPLFKKYIFNLKKVPTYNRGKRTTDIGTTKIDIYYFNKVEIIQERCDDLHNYRPPGIALFTKSAMSGTVVYTT
ncbi:hypothetical protein H072_4418 [Dactylellina haptotyla CBS 200.50]|uniref:Uncharacterized protein n=1 Tax=Dactylellina haptotyla (strain CBS 200.50) TaxID=1284197 RepID=S8C254_DACHA|nr:hypothetical protein H072_4418 [Dactylellina haptotyla CBS 200.50]